MTDPKRREQRRTHLDASVVPVERALLARADALEDSDELREAWRATLGLGAGGWVHGGGGEGGAAHVVGVGGTAIGGHGGAGGGASTSGGGMLALLVAAEFRALAEELHWW